MQQRTRTLAPRSLGEILNETFSIYSKHLRRFLLLVGVVQVPITVLSQLLGGGLTSYIVVGTLGVVGSVVVHAAGVIAVGQQYVLGEIDIGNCYRRVSWRILSLLVIGVVIALASGIILAMAVTGVLLLFALFFLALLLPMIVAVSYMIYWSMAVQAVVMEGYKPIAALRRSFNLVRGSWWRVFGLTIVFGLVGLGLGIIVEIPFAVASRIAAPEDPTTVSSVIQLFGAIAAVVSVPPVLFTAGTLLYYDLRVRKEDYDVETLSREMGLAAA